MKWLVVLLVLCNVARAAVFQVNSAEDVSDGDLSDGFCALVPCGDNATCTLRAAVEQANAMPGDTLILLPEGQFRIGELAPDAEHPGIRNQLFVVHTITIQGVAPTRELSVIMPRDPIPRVFMVKAGAGLTLKNLSIVEGRSTPGENCKIAPGQDEGTPRKGGCIYNAGTLVVDNVFTDHCENKLEQDQSGPERPGPSNTTLGGGLGQGGSIYNAAMATTIMRNGTHIMTSIANWGGGVFNAKDGLVQATDTTFEDNHTLGTDWVHENENYPDWGGIGALGDTAGGGAGVFNLGIFELTRGAFIYTRGRLGQGGGGILNGDECTDSTAATKYCDYTKADRRADGGVGLGFGGIVRLTNVTFSRNRCRRCGGGALRSAGGVVELKEVTFGGTQSYWQSGITFSNGVAVDMSHVAIEGHNISAQGDPVCTPLPGEDCIGPSPTKYYNCFIDMTKLPPATITLSGPCMDDSQSIAPPHWICAPGFLTEVDLRLPSQEKSNRFGTSTDPLVKTLLPISNPNPSPLIDTGDPTCIVNQDARYYYRPQNRLGVTVACDIGAVEVQPHEGE